jgi:DNA-binding transcriptional ArsR family regulator
MNVDPKIMIAASGQASELLKSLGNPVRLMIVCQILNGEKSVGELADFLKSSQSTVSQHLALLRKDGIVSPRREAQTIYYSISSAPAKAIITVLYDLYCAPGGICNPNPAQAKKRARTKS